MVLYRLPIDKKLIALTANAEDEGVPGRSAAPYTWRLFTNQNPSVVRSGADPCSSEQQKLQATTESTATTQTRCFTPSIFCPTPLFSARCCDFAAAVAVASTRIAPGDSALGVVASSMARPLLQEGYQIRWHYLSSLLPN